MKEVLPVILIAVGIVVILIIVILVESFLVSTCGEGNFSGGGTGSDPDNWICHAARIGRAGR